MNSHEFALWIRGAIELGGKKTFNESDVKMINDHLDLFLNKVTPNRIPLGNGSVLSVPTVFTVPGEPVANNNDWMKFPQNGGLPRMQEQTVFCANSCIDTSKTIC